MSKMAQNGQNPENSTSGPWADPSRDNSSQPKVMIENFSQISEISKSQKSKCQKWPKISNFRPPDPLATQSKNTEIEELGIQRSSRTCRGPNSKFQNHQNCQKFVKIFSKFDKILSKCQNFDQFRQFWSQRPSDPHGTCQAPSAIARLFREISIWAWAVWVGIWGLDPKIIPKWPKSTPGPSNFDPWDLKKTLGPKINFDPDPQILTPLDPNLTLDPNFDLGPSNFDPQFYPGAQNGQNRPWDPPRPRSLTLPRPLPGPQLPSAGPFPPSRQTLPDPDRPKIAQNDQNHKIGPKWPKLTLKRWNLSQIFWPQNDPPVQMPLTKIPGWAIFWEVPEPSGPGILGRGPKMSQRPKMAKMTRLRPDPWPSQTPVRLQLPFAGPIRHLARPSRTPDRPKNRPKWPKPTVKIWPKCQNWPSILGPINHRTLMGPVQAPQP